MGPGAMGPNSPMGPGAMGPNSPMGPGAMGPNSPMGPGMGAAPMGPGPGNNYPGWGGQQPFPRAPSPSASQPPRYSNPPSSQRPSMPPERRSMQGMQEPMLKPWMLIVGAIIMAALAFLITRAFI
jgi:hypothetical protein